MSEEKPIPRFQLSRGALAQDHGAACAGGRWKIARHGCTRARGQNRERDGLFRVRIDAVVGGGGQLRAGQKFAQAPHELSIVHAAAGSDHFASLSVRISIGDRRWRCSSVAVAIRSAAGSRWRSARSTNSRPNCSRPQRFGRVEGEVRVAEHRRSMRSWILPGARCGRRGRNAACRPCKLRHQRIDNHVAGAGVERDDVVRARIPPASR